MAWKLFLDDDADTYRKPSLTVENVEWRRKASLRLTIPETSHLGEWHICRSYDAAINAICLLGFPSFVSFDHDLSYGKSGYDVAKYLVDLDLEEGTMPDDFLYEVHSSNPIGRINIQCLLENYMSQK